MKTEKTTLPPLHLKVPLQRAIEFEEIATGAVQVRLLLQGSRQHKEGTIKATTLIPKHLRQQIADYLRGGLLAAVCLLMLAGCQIAKRAEPVSKQSAQLVPVSVGEAMLATGTWTNWFGKQIWLAPGVKFRKQMPELPPEPPLMMVAASCVASSPSEMTTLTADNPNLQVMSWTTNVTLTGTHGVSLPLKFDGSVKHFRVYTNEVLASEFDLDTTVYPFPLWADDPNTKFVEVKMTP